MTRALLRTLTVALVLTLAAACSVPGPGSVVKRFYFLLSAGQTGAAIKECSRELKSFGPKLDVAMEEAAREIRQKGGVRSVQVESEEIQGNTAKLVVLITLKDGSTKKERHVLVLEEGRWRLSSSK
jgi:phage gp46-like protein